MNEACSSTERMNFSSMDLKAFESFIRRYDFTNASRRMPDSIVLQAFADPGSSGRTVSIQRPAWEAKHSAYSSSPVRT